MKFHALLHYVAYILVIAGALNWGIVGALNIDLLGRVFGAGSFAARILYILIGVSAIILLVM